MFKINNEYTTTTQWSRSGVVIVNVEHILLPVTKWEVQKQILVIKQIIRF